MNCIKIKLIINDKKIKVYKVNIKANVNKQ